MRQSDHQPVAASHSRAMNHHDFPANFLFGAATSAYQVEGGIENDWSNWERAGKTKTICGRAIDHWNRFEEDYDLLLEAGLSAYRLSVEWARLEPKPGRFDDQAFAHYRAMLQALRRRRVQVMVTLHHFTHPLWFHRHCPWTKSSSVDAFACYVRKVAQELSGLVDFYVTFNEPMVLLMGGYVDGQMPPGQKDLRAFGEAAANIMRAHVIARSILREVDDKARVGIAHNVLAVAPLRAWNPADRHIARYAHALYNHAVVRALTGGELSLRMPFLLKNSVKIDGGNNALDFLGINYYSRIHLGMKLAPGWVQIKYRDVNNRGLSDLGWEYFPEGFRALIDEMSEYRLPIYITENGIADAKGDRRNSFLYDHLSVVRDALRKGVDIRGYFHWSLLDNFEWLEGLGPRFGLFQVDFKTLARTPTSTVNWIRELARTGRLTAP